MGSEGGWSRGRASAMSMTKAVPKAQLRCVLVDALVATRKGERGLGSENGINDEQDNGCSHRPSCNV